MKKHDLIMYVLALLLALPGVFAVTNLSQNETFAFNYTNATNQSAIEVFYCAAHNESFCSAVNLTLNLSTGDTITRSNGTCSVTASCAAPLFPSNATCVINRTVAPGESFTNRAGPCDVSITVTGGANETVEVPQRVNVTVVKDGEVVRINIGGKQFDVPLTGEFQYSQLLEPVCPLTPEFQETDDVDYLVRQCRSWVPMLDDTISTLVANTRECSESARTHVDDIKDCGERERIVLSEKADLQSQLDQVRSDLEFSRSNENVARQKETEATVRAETNKALAWLWFVCFVLSAVLIAVIMATSRIRRGGYARGGGE